MSIGRKASGGSASPRIPALLSFVAPSSGYDIDLDDFTAGPQILFFYGGSYYSIDSIRAYPASGTVTVPLSDIPGSYTGPGYVCALYVVLEGEPGNWTFRSFDGTVLFSGVSSFRFFNKRDSQSLWGYGISARL